MEIAGLPGAVVTFNYVFCPLPHAIAAKKCTHETYQRQG